MSKKKTVGTMAANPEWMDLRMVTGSFSEFYARKTVVVTGAEGWWRGMVSDIWFNSYMPAYKDLDHKTATEEEKDKALRDDAQEFANSYPELVEAAGVDVEWLVNNFWERL